MYLEYYEFEKFVEIKKRKEKDFFNDSRVNYSRFEYRNVTNARINFTDSKRKIRFFDWLCK